MTGKPPFATTEGTSRPLNRRQRWWALSVLALSVLVVGVDAMVLALASPFLSEDLARSSTQLLWIGDVYSFVIAGLLISMGSLGDRIGRKTAAAGRRGRLLAPAARPATGELTEPAGQNAGSRPDQALRHHA